jgi:colanic acid/amylovoran biosynthesis glycosyltransferase
VGDGILRNALTTQIEKLKLGGSIRLLGWKSQEEIVELLKQADILLAPSITGNDGDEEGIPTTIMEAFALGLPVISTQHSGIPELVQDGQSGFLVPERDADALAQKLECLIKEPEKRHAMGRNGRTFVEQHHDIDQLNDQLVKIYQQLLNNASLHARGPLVASAELT